MTLTFYFFVVFTVQYVLVSFTCDKRFFSGEHEIYNISFLLQATVLCDIVVLYVLKKKYLYREKKYLLVDDTEIEPDDIHVCWSCLVLLFFQLDDKVWSYWYRSIFSSEQPFLTIENFEQLGPSELIYWPVKEMLY